MTNEIDLELRNIYKSILIALLTIDTFDYFEKNADIKKVVLETLQDESIFEQNEKSKILLNIQNFDFNSISDRALFARVKYKQCDNIYNIFKRQFSLYTGLSMQDKKNLLFLDICQNSILASIFYNNDIPFLLSDFFKVYEFVFSPKRHYNLKATIKKAEESGLVKSEESMELFCINQKLHDCELKRLGSMPYLEEFSLNDYITTERKSKKLLSDHQVTVFTGECKSSYLFSRFQTEKIRFHYANDYNECKQILNYLKNNNLKNECIWLDNYEPDTEPLDEKELLLEANRVKAKLIISGSHLEVIKPFGKKCTIISLKDSCLENLVKKQFPRLLTKKINLCIKKIRNSESKRRFIFEILDLLQDTDPEFISKSLDEYFNVFQRCENELRKDSGAKGKKETERKSPNIITALDKSDFEKRYGDIFDELSNPILSAEYSKLINIFKKLSAPAMFLTANKNMLDQFDALLEQYPNIFPEDKELIRSFFKNSVILSEDHIINLPNLLLVGNTGCGKTRFVQQFRALIGQKRDCFIACGTGCGQDEIVGSDATYKNAGPGKILTSIWESMDSSNITCLNNLVIFDEIDKSKWTSTGDSNQDLYGTMLLILGQENLKLGYKDNFLDIRIPLLKPNFVLTANSIEPIPEPILDRVQIIRFRDYNEEEIQKIVIPAQYQEFKNKYNTDLLPPSLNQMQIQIISQMSRGKTRRIQTSLEIYFAALCDNNGVKHDLSTHEINYLLEHSINNSTSKRIGFYNR